MTAPSKLPIQPGTLCWFRHPAAKENVGKIVEVIRPCNFFAGEDKFWFAKAKTSMQVVLLKITNPSVSNGFTSWPAGKEFVVKESWLVLIVGPGLVDEVAAYDKRLASSTPFVRR